MKCITRFANNKGKTAATIVHGTADASALPG
jgi:hypothetical protein